ncbi:MAG: 1-phosphofructokinase family hexose kinase [Candidatus Omnitrophota bacterium]|nr:MAG: 1-phosphofructokinase family hexose kinase [Candidatus Omnitrophota bacterium]
MKPYILTVTLNPAIDKTVSVPGFKVGEDFREQALSISAGGKGINVSRVLRRLGVDTRATGFIGGYCGSYIERQLRKEGINYDFTQVKVNTRTSLTIIDSRLNTITRVLERGGTIKKVELNSFRKKFLSLLKGAKVVVLSGRNIPGVQDSFYAELIDVAKKKGAVTIFDTSGPAFTVGLKKKPFMIKPNLAEVEQILADKLVSLAKIKKAAYSLYKRGVKIVAITMGSRGAVLFNGKDMVLAVPPKLRRRSPVGCGDAFIAGFISSFIKNSSFPECARMAVSCGAANALSINPGFIKPATVKKIFKQVKIDSIS